jgi:hypothetical protein
VEGLVLLLLFALGGGSSLGGGGNGGGTSGGGDSKGDDYKGGPAGPGSRPSGNPPGGCRQIYDSAGNTSQALNMLGYSPMPQIFGPDDKLGTYDADPDPAIRQFQLDYNQGSRSKYLGTNAGGLGTDGLMGKCTMAAMFHVRTSVGDIAWRERYAKPTASLGNA